MRRTLAIASAAVLLALLAGCVPSPPKVPTPEPTVTPVFANDEEALAAAEAAYRAYETEVDRALATYDTSSLATVSEGEALTETIASVASFQAQGKKLVGSSALDRFSLVSRSLDFVQIYACHDVSGTDVRASDGSSSVNQNGTSRFPMIVSLTWRPESSSLIVSEAIVWSGSNFCG